MARGCSPPGTNNRPPPKTKVLLPDRPLILILDEFPYLVAKEPSIEAVLQKVWDRALQSAPVLVLLIGSDEAMMRALTEQGRPLYDRLREMVVRPLSPAETSRTI